MDVTANSKAVKPGSIFFALKGAKFDGHQFIDEALKLGASKVYSEFPYPDPRVVALGSVQARRKLGELASEQYGHPTHELKMIGVTGTSGKTTTTYLIQHLLNSIGFRCARLGTNGAEFAGHEVSTVNTTPDALTLQAWFRSVLDRGATHVVMEVSSHSLEQNRVWGIAWDVATFLNLSPEHLDYHPTIENYYECKALLFGDHAEASKRFKKSPVLAANAGTPWGRKLIQDHQAIAWSAEKDLKNIHETSVGIEGEIRIQNAWHRFQCPLFGTFQSENILAALKAAESLVDKKEHPKLVSALSTFAGVPGRMEAIENSRGIRVLVDYAHKPEALEKVLQSIQGAPVITVVGCGGDRDRTKRPVMGEISTRLSKWVILTSDNPRTENPESILREIEAGIKSKNFEIIEDRGKAIRKAISIAKPGDTVLIAGKGHEDYQIVGSTKKHFDDREEARKALHQ